MQSVRLRAQKELVVLVKRTRNKEFGKLRKKRMGYRFIGWWFLLLGGFMCFTFGNVMLDPDGVITYNGVDTTSFEVKQNAFFFTLIFPVIGAVLALLPRKLLTKILIWQARSNPFKR